jgi:carboxylate-amine ligase
VTTERCPFHLFEAYGIELEYMIVDRETLDIRPMADKVLYEIAGAFEADVVVGELIWSNEIVLHVIELKNNSPARSLTVLGELFHRHTERVNEILEPLNAGLLPTAMHPWMDPVSQMSLWPHADSLIYQTYDRIFNCRAHGWTNIQATQINLPFADDHEFCSLHAAVRLLLPIMPALSASSPLVDGCLTGEMDSRMIEYRKNSAIIPSITGSIIPEQIFTLAEYDEKILRRIYADVLPHDPEGILQSEWLNSRGAIPRYSRGAIEIKVLDIQEAPAADLAIAWAIIEALRMLTAERWTSLQELMDWHEKPLLKILLDVVRDAGSAVINDSDYLSVFDYPEEKCTAGELWAHIIESVPESPDQMEFREPLAVILKQGSLARRIVNALGNDFSRGRLKAVYNRLRQCLEQNGLFSADGF